jgi:hypothetical protein
MNTRVKPRNERGQFMPQSPELGGKVCRRDFPLTKEKTRDSAFISSTNEMKTTSILTETNVELFKKTFTTQEKYVYHVRALWILRDLLSDKIESECKGSFKTNPAFPLLDTINEIIGCLLVYDIHFDFNGNAYKCVNGKKEYLSFANN